MGRIEKQKRQLINEANKRMLGEGFSWLLTGIAIFSFYKFIQGLRGKGGGNPLETPKGYGESNWGTLNVYISDFLKDGGKIEYEDNGWYHVFKVGDVTIKIDQNNKTVFWTYIVPDIKRFLKYKTSKRYELTNHLDEIEHDYTIPIPISQHEIDELVNSIKQDITE